MKNISFKVSFFFLIISTFACLDYETQGDGPYDPEEDAERLTKSVVYILDGNVYLGNQFLGDSILIDDAGDNTHVSINNNHTKVIFKAINQPIKIYDIESGSMEGSIAGSEEARWFDYHANQESIYYLIGNELFTFGKEILSNSPIDLAEAYGNPTAIVNTAGIHNNNAIIFSLTEEGINQTEHLLLIYEESDNGANVSEIADGPTDNLSYDFIRFNKDYTAIWLSDLESSSISTYRYTEYDDVFDFGFSITDAKMGTPFYYKDGLYITNNNEVSLYALNEIKILDGAVISAIDF